MALGNRRRCRGNVYREHDGFAGGLRTHSIASKSSVMSGASSAISAIAYSSSGGSRRVGARVGLTSSPYGLGVTVRRGKAVKAEGFLSRNEALKAAGMQE
jgi:hypothetical protein